MIPGGARALVPATSTLPSAGGTSTGKQVFSKGIEITDDDGTTAIDGYRALALIEPPNADPEVVGILIKDAGPAWGIGQDYAEGNYIVCLSDAANFKATPANNLKTITATTNATPVKVTAVAHGYTTGDIVRINGTGIAAIDNKWWKATRVDADNFTLDTSTAPGSTSAIGFAFSDGSPVLSRVSTDGWGMGSIHIAPGLRGRSGSTPPTQGVWIQAFSDAVPLVIQNADPTALGATPVSNFVTIIDSRSSPTRVLVKVEADGAITTRPQAGKAALGTMFRVRDDTDASDLMLIYANGWVQTPRVLALQTATGTPALGANMPTGATVNIAEFSLNNVVKFLVNKLGYPIWKGLNSAPADADIGNNQMAFWFDSTSGAAKLMVKGKDAGGTVRTATVAMA